MKISIGDRVETIDDAIIGVVNRININTVTITTDDGFEFQFEAKELVVLTSNNSIASAIFDVDIEAIKKEKAVLKRKASKSVKAKARHAARFEVDLHIHHLTSSTKGMSNFDMLNLQLDTAKSQLEFAIKNRIPKMVFIHGVGEGVLRQELVTLLGRYNNLEFYDADYRTYGIGATEVRLFQN